MGIEAIERFLENSTTWAAPNPYFATNQVAVVFDAWSKSVGPDVPFIITDDVYTIQEEVSAYVKSTVVDTGDSGLQMPVKRAIIPPYYTCKVPNDMRARTEADFIFGIVASSWIFADEDTIEAWKKVVEKHLSWMKTRFLIVSGLENLEGLNPHLEFDWIVDKAAELGCRVAFIGGLATWFQIQSRLKGMRHNYAPVNVTPPHRLSAEFVTKLAEVSGGAVTKSVAKHIWGATNGNRMQAIALAGTIAQLRYEEFAGEITEELVLRLVGKQKPEHSSTPCCLMGTRNQIAH